MVPISPLPPELLSTSGAPGEVLDEEAILLQPGSALGIFVRRVLLGFNSLSFEVRPVTQKAGTVCQSHTKIMHLDRAASLSI